MADDVSQLRAALRECPPGHSDHFSSVNNLAISLRDRFLQYGVPSDLDEGIDLHRAALALCPPGNSDSRTMSLNNLALSLQDRFEEQGVLSDLDEAIDLHRTALALHPHGHDFHSASLNNLAISLQERFNQRGVLSDLDEAIDFHQAALALCPPGHPDRSMSLNNLATSLQERFNQQGIMSDLDEAIDLYQAALVLHPPGHSDQFSSLSNLASSLQERFNQKGVLSDLNEAVDLHQAALALCPPGHYNRATSLNNLACSLQDRFKLLGVLSDPDKAIDLHRAALSLHPPGHSNRFMSLNNLAAGLQTRFNKQHGGVLSDLDEAIDLHRAALELCPPGHSRRSSALNNLASSLEDRFEQQGILLDLDEAINLHKAALALCPPGHHDRSMFLSNLALGLHNRFKQHHVPSVSDLNVAIEHLRAALALCPPGHSDRSVTLNNLAIGLQDKFKQCGILSDLDEAIDLLQIALTLRPPGHSRRSSTLNNLVNSLKCRFEQCGAQSDLDEAIELHRAALALHPFGHSNRSMSLNNLAISLQYRFKQCGAQPDLDEAIDLHRAVLALHPHGHATWSSSLNNLVNCLRDRLTEQALPSDLEEVFRLYAQLSEVSHTVVHGDIEAAKSWATLAEQLKHGSVLASYQTAVKFLDDWQNVAGLSSSHHFEVLREVTSSLAMDAFSCGVRCGALPTAVELIEQCRAVSWMQLAPSPFHTPLDKISASGDAGKALAAEFKELTLRLYDMSRSEVPSDLEDRTAQLGIRIRQLTMQRDCVISQIRMLPDFSRFLLPPLFSDLQMAAEYGPVIIVNASQYSCDALIILSAQDPVHVPLDITRAEVSDLSTEFLFLIEDAGSSDDGLEVQKIVGVLRKIWERIVSPIDKALRASIPRGSRIWWCPTSEFTLLPLHAAGPYAKKSYNLSHFYISSYTPTLAALIRARQQVPQDSSTPQFLAIGQGNPDKGKELPHVAAELDDVAHRVSPNLSLTSLTGGDGTVQEALDALSRHQWVHLACHGMPNQKKPFESSFAMRDGPLTITDIIQRRLQNPEFAFLSACHTTVDHASSPDEAIHLAVAMQFSGFRSVIGSMWSVDDEVAGQVVSAFYENMFDGSGRLDRTLAAVALHKAVKKLRKKIPFEQQIVFIHVGV